MSKKIWNQYYENKKARKNEVRKEKPNLKVSRVISSKKMTDEYQFFDSDFWRKYRYKTFVKKGNTCSSCSCSADQSKLDVYSMNESLKNTDVNKYLDSLFVLCEPCRISRNIPLKKHIQTKNSRIIRNISSNNSGFYNSKVWLELRNKVFLIKGMRCSCCGETKGEFHADHIKPRSKYPFLELVFENIQVLCWICNLGKSNFDETNWSKNKE